MPANLTKSSVYLVATQVGTEGLALGRNVLLARLLGPAEMGLAAMLALTLRLAEMVSDFATDRLLIQAPEGNESKFQATAHGFQILRGCVSGVLLSACSVPLASLFGQTHSAWTFAFLGFIPIARGFTHLDYKRVQRTLAFRQTACVELAAGTAAMLVCVPLALALRDYRAVIVMSMIQGCVLVLVSHVIAVRPYRAEFDRALVRRFVEFGWPLAVNGLILFGVFQGDRIVVAFSCTPEDLGRYAVAFQLSFLPVLVIARSASTMFLPVLSRCGSQSAQFIGQFSHSQTLLSSVGVLYGYGFMIFGGLAIRVIYGAEYVVPVGVIHWLALTQSVRLLRTTPGIAAIALGDSRLPLLVNIFRVFGIVGAAWAGYCGLGLSAIVAAGFGGELAALIAAVAFLWRRHDVPLTVWRDSFGLAFSGLSLAWLSPLGWVVPGEVSLCGTASYLLLFLAFVLVGVLSVRWLSSSGALGAATTPSSSNIHVQQQA